MKRKKMSCNGDKDVINQPFLHDRNVKLILVDHSKNILLNG